MLDPVGQVALYYLGFGFVIVLCWAAALHVVNADVPSAQAVRYLRWAAVAAGVGVLHPVLALSARDIVQQLAPDLPDHSKRASTLANTCIGASVAVFVVVVALVAR